MNYFVPIGAVMMMNTVWNHILGAAAGDQRVVCLSRFQNPTPAASPTDFGKTCVLLTPSSSQGPMDLFQALAMLAQMGKGNGGNRHQNQNQMMMTRNQRRALNRKWAVCPPPCRWTVR